MEMHVVILLSAIKFTGGVVDSASFAAVRCKVSHHGLLQAAVPPIVEVIYYARSV